MSRSLFKLPFAFPTPPQPHPVVAMTPTRPLPRPVDAGKTICAAGCFRAGPKAKSAAGCLSAGPKAERTKGCVSAEPNVRQVFAAGCFSAEPNANASLAENGLKRQNFAAGCFSAGPKALFCTRNDLDFATECLSAVSEALSCTRNDLDLCTGAGSGAGAGVSAAALVPDSSGCPSGLAGVDPSGCPSGLGRGDDPKGYVWFVGRGEARGGETPAWRSRVDEFEPVCKGELRPFFPETGACAGAADSASTGYAPCNGASERNFSDQEWPSLLSKPFGVKELWADMEEADWDLDSQLLAQMETREDRERGADSANLETFGSEAGAWSYEDQVAANESLEVEPPPPLPEDPAWTRQKERMSAEQRSFVTTAVWSSSGLLWGKCTCCDKWIMDVDHFKSKSYLK